MFNERNIYGVDVVPVLLGLKSIRSCVIWSAAPDKPDLTEVGGRLLLYTFNIFSYSISL